MRIAFLLLCHKNPKQINKLIERLNKFNSEIFIHIDKKNYEISTNINKAENVHILSQTECFDVKWGGIDMIYATLKLIDFAIKYSNVNNITFNYYWLISGQDYLIQKPSVVNEFLIKNQGVNFINIVEENKKEYNIYKKLYEMYYPNWITENKILIKIIKRIYMLITGGFNYTFKIYRRKTPNNMKLNFGSQWWTLTDECVQYINKYCTNNNHVLEYYKNCIIPDESFFQTIVTNSKYSNTVKNNLTFVNWGKNRRSPEILKNSDFEKIKKINNEYFMARKFDLEISKELTDKIDILVNGVDEK